MRKSRSRKQCKKYTIKKSKSKKKTIGKRRRRKRGGGNGESNSLENRMNSNNRRNNQRNNHHSNDDTRKSYPVYSRKKWNKNKMVKRGHNCYTYFLDKISKEVIQDCREKHGLSKYDTKQTRSRKIRKRKPCGKPQPGYYAGMERYPKNETSCEHLHKRIIADNPDIYPVEFNGKKLPAQMCNDEEYAGALVVHPNKTYHFYRQDGDGSWSHKPGSLQTTKNDASGKPITNPKYADRTYKNFDYSDFCSFYCIPKDIRKRNYSLRRRKNADE